MDDILWSVIHLESILIQWTVMLIQSLVTQQVSKTFLAEKWQIIYLLLSLKKPRWVCTDGVGITFLIKQGKNLGCNNLPVFRSQCLGLLHPFTVHKETTVWAIKHIISHFPVFFHTSGCKLHQLCFTSEMQLYLGK